MIDYEDMMLLLKRACEDRPNFTYPEHYEGSPWHLDDGNHTNRYTLEDGTPGCIMGWVLHDLGLQSHIKEGFGIDSILHGINDEEQTFSPSAICLAEAVQYYQDTNLSWETSLNYATGRYES